MAKLGSKKNPVVLRVQTERRAHEVVEMCAAHGLQYIVGIEPGEREDISDLERALNQPAPAHVATIGRNDPCPCGSGKKYKQCCGRQS
ncbi:MAG: SEC-C metal-binding domain-containing protein [Chloroflexi bacterium]|nr:SEC-C metal-binding domain-containing protein [Chloroflexota bacterium]